MILMQCHSAKGPSVRLHNPHPVAVKGTLHDNLIARHACWGGPGQDGQLQMVGQDVAVSPSMIGPVGVVEQRQQMGSNTTAHLASLRKVHTATAGAWCC